MSIHEMAKRAGGPAAGNGRGAGRRVAALLSLLLLLLLSASCGEGDARAAPESGGSAASPAPADTLAPGSVEGRDTSLVRVARAVLPAVQEESGLSLVKPLAVARTDSQRVRAYLLQELREDLPAERAAAVGSAYARLGLLPDSIDLPALMRKLYLEQVVGYYDPRRDTLYVREGVSEEQFEPVLVHEMTHALQDEHMDLDSLMRAREDDNDAGAAARAALEGQATFVMLEWQLRKTVGPDADLTTIPSLGSLLSNADVLSSGVGKMPVLAGAPALIQQSLLFPYLDGLTFMQAFWRARSGRPAPLNGDMPASSEQVMHPARFLSTPRDAPTRIEFVTDSSAPAPGWSQVYSDDLGEFETRFYLSTFLGDTARARLAATGWDGDRYRLLRRCGPDRDGTAGAGGRGCPEALVWASVWDTPAAADTFAVAVRRALAARYGGESGSGRAGWPPADSTGTAVLRTGGRVLRVTRSATDGRPTVLVVDLPRGIEAESVAPARAFHLQGGG